MTCNSGYWRLLLSPSIWVIWPLERQDPELLARTPSHLIPALWRSKLNASRLNPYPFRQGALYTAYGVVILLLILGVCTAGWLWQVKDWGIEFDEAGQVMAVQPDSQAAQSGVLPGDIIEYTQLHQLRRLSGTVG